MLGMLQATDIAQASDLQGRISLSVMEFGYKEFADGKLLDRESGFLPGISAALTRTQNQWFVSGESSYHSGEAWYRGQTQSGVPLDTGTGEKMLDLGLNAGRWFGTREDYDLAVYAGWGYHRWERDIHARSNIRGLFEIYNWWYGFLGIKGIVYRTETLRSEIDLRLTRTAAARITVNFNGAYDDARLNLGERFGGRLALPWRYQLRSHSAISLEPYFEAWNLGRSRSKPLLRNGSVVGSVHEPSSETRNYGLMIGIVQSF